MNKKARKSEKTLDTRFPQMFRDEDADLVLARATKVSDLKNLGPASEEAFSKAGIKTAKQFIKMGWEKAFIRLVKSNKKNRHSVFAYALIGAIKNIEWNMISSEDKQAAKNLAAKLKKK